MLAKTHAPSSKATPIANFIGNDDSFDGAMAQFSATYSEQAHYDCKLFLAVIEAGDLVSSQAWVKVDLRAVA